MGKDETKELFRSRGIKNTNQRQMIYSFLSSRNQPITAEDIYMELSGNEDTRLNLSTVYRILDTFTKKGLVIKSSLNMEGKATYEINHREHRHHLVCVKCNKILPIKGCPLEGYEMYLAERTGFRILEHQLEIRGVCPECMKNVDFGDKPR